MIAAAVMGRHVTEAVVMGFAAAVEVVVITVERVGT